MNKGQTKKEKIEINSLRTSVLVATYGTLRLNQGNWSYLLKDKSEWLGTYQTEPIFTMQGRHSGFPIVFRGGETRITYDLFRITDSRVLESCHRLEGSSGIVDDENGWYKLTRLYNEEYGESFMYTQIGIPSKASVIESGDWEDKNI